MIRSLWLLPISLVFFNAALPAQEKAESNQPSDPTKLVQASTDLMAFNIRLGVAKDGDNHWEKRKELVFGVIRDREPDFVGMQEAWKFQIDEIAKALPDYAWVGRSRQADPTEGEWCPIFYRKDRWEPVAKVGGTFWLSDTPEKEGSMDWGNEIPRICTWSRFRSKETGFAFDLYNTHFDHQSQPSRERSAVLVADRIEIHSGGHPFVLMGDFNAAPDNPAMKTLASTFRAPMVDTFAHLHPKAEKSGTFNGWHGKDDGARIDAIYVSPRLGSIRSAAIVKDNTDGRYPSDHFPVTATVDWIGLNPVELRSRAEIRRGIAQADAILAKDEKNAGAWHQRGMLRYFDGDAAGSVADFDRELELRPDSAPHHWQRGLSVYYTGEFEKGVKQFTIHDAVNATDVENAVWLMACEVAGGMDLEKSRAKLIPFRGDARTPMKEVHALFSGTATAEDVIDACGVEPNHLCYGHLYCGLFAEISGDQKAAKAHMLKAARDHRQFHYMGQVAYVHALLRGWLRE